MMLSTLAAAAIAPLLALAPAAAPQASPFQTGAMLFEEVFNPELYFAGEIQPHTYDELILTVVTAARDDYAPQHALALAHVCTRGENAVCRYEARMLRISEREDGGTSGIALVSRVGRARGEREVRAALDAADLDWLEADLSTCDGVVAAIEGVRTAEWRPDVAFSLAQRDTTDIILHPAMIRVEMRGVYTTTSYRGWVLAAGVPAAARRLAEVLEPCWRPGRAQRPWERPDRGPSLR